MLYDERMCKKGMMCHGEVRSHELSVKRVLKDEESKRAKHVWPRSGKRRWHGHPPPPPPRPRHAPVSAWLRPANVRGRRAPGMRAPRNTNQFLMREKYQLMHMRSDSVGADSSSDCELDPADMDSYLGVLENARGALLDSPELPTFTSSQTLHLFTFPEAEREDSMQYFPSENDVLQSEDFMQRDFIQFCDAVACT